jgi:hypothetical protein
VERSLTNKEHIMTTSGVQFRTKLALMEQIIVTRGKTILDYTVQSLDT